MNTSFTPPKDSLKIKTIDMHTGRKPLRVIVEGFPKLKGFSVLKYKDIVKKIMTVLRHTSSPIKSMQYGFNPDFESPIKGMVYFCINLYKL